MSVLRKISKSDAPLMLEWMHDKDYWEYFQKGFSKFTLGDVESFCSSCKSIDDVEQDDNLHFAIVDKKNEYLGTVSLKNIDFENKLCEYAICLRKLAWGKQIGKLATLEVLELAFFDLGMYKIYLNVLSSNKRAISMYESLGFKKEGFSKKHVIVLGKRKDLFWYSINIEDYKKWRQNENIAK